MDLPAPGVEDDVDADELDDGGALEDDVDVDVLVDLLVLDDEGALDEVLVDVDGLDDDELALDECVADVDASEVCFASTGVVDLPVDEDVVVTAPDVPVRGGWLLAGGSPDPPSRTKPPRTSNPTTTAAARAPRTWPERCERGGSTGSPTGMGATTGSWIGGPTAAATGANGIACVAEFRNVRATSTADGRAAASSAVIAASSPGHGAGSDGGIGGGCSRWASIVAIWPSPS